MIQTTKRIAVMDLGTNVFHLLIAEQDHLTFKEIVHLQEPVKIGEGGIIKGLIQPMPFARGLVTMKIFLNEISANHADIVKAIATSALRNAANGLEFVEKVKAETGINIEIIDGEQEAAYIYQGIRASGCLGDKTSLIIDIGGGSVEFIIANNEQVFWKQSFEIGAARLMDLFHQTDPIPGDAIAALQQRLDEKLPDLFEAVKDRAIENLVGSSGAFETFAELVELQNQPDFNIKEHKSYQFELPALMDILNWFIQSSHAERAANKHIPPVRVDMIVVSAVITRYIIEKLKVDKVLMSTYSLKEGVLAEILAR